MPDDSSAMSSPAEGSGTPIEAESSSYVISSGNSNYNEMAMALEAVTPPAHELQLTPNIGSTEAPGSVFDFPKENGRYHFPNDSTETERLDFQHDLLRELFSNRNYFAPLSNPQTILDIGTGTGRWAIEMGDEFPNAEVQATDLSPIQPSDVPQNVQFFVDDASESDWAVPEAHFDYIHTRVMLGSFASFKDIINRAFYYTRPGGYMESQEFFFAPCCDDKTMSSKWPFLEWAKYSEEAAREAERPLNIASKLKRWYEEAGFVDVKEKTFKLPLNGWPKDRRLKSLGKMSEDNWLAGLGGFTMGPFSRGLGWSKNEIEVYLVNIRKSISDRNVHAYHKVIVVWGRKP